MSAAIYQVDAFTDEPFAGNPAAVCVLPESHSERWMQNVAKEMNLPETAFLCRQIELNFPATPEEPIHIPPELAKALGVPLVYAGRSRFDYLVQVESEQVVRDLRPNLAALKTLPVRGTIVTSVATSLGYDIVSRFFAPAAGIDKDPVTGSAHCCLGPCWYKRLGRKELVAYQASERGGVLSVRVAGDRVYLGGKAITVLCGELVFRS